MRVFHDVEHSDICANISVQKQNTFSVPISFENCGRETPIKMAGKNVYQIKINSI